FEYVSSSNMSDSDDIDLSPELKRRVDKENEIATAERTIEVNLNTREDPQIVLLGESLNEEELNGLTTLLKRYKDVFVWTYQDMPGVDRD
ncbi:hypothetical protein ODX52_19450, partial [Salmonella enterica subsp. enterica serovar Senftenberg]|uniref:hypothetical protein n=1 Tax=Salmonella enterica TaxID=28901 RepID=UPI0032E445E7